FADRVVRAAMAEAEKHNAAATTAALPPPAEGRKSRRWMIGAAVASAAALAACFLLAVQPWRSAGGPQPGPLVVSPGSPGEAVQQIAISTNDFLNSLRGALPAEG